MSRDEGEAEIAARRVFSLVALAFATIFLITVAVACWVYYSEAPAVDFASFWAAGRLALSGSAADAYDVDVHRAIEMTVAHMGGLMPFPYPPPFLFPVMLIAFRPFWAAYLLWMAIGSGIYLAATRPLMAPRFAFAHPACLVNAIIGQNGFLTAGLFILGVTLVSSQPIAAGAVLGLLVVKPQLGVLLPVALIAAREWRAFAAAAVSSLALLGLAAIAFGPDSYRSFLAITGQYAQYLGDSRWRWTELASVFAFLRYFGVSQALALALQACAALAGAVLTWRGWSKGSSNRCAILAAATLLVSPYVLTYDSLLLVLPLSAFLHEKGRPWRPAIIWMCLLAPLLAYFGYYPGPNSVPVAAILSLWWLSAEAGGNRAPAPAAEHERTAAPFGTAVPPS